MTGVQTCALPISVVVDPKDAEAFLDYAAEENLEAVTVAVVTENPRLKMSWRGKTIVDISRAFLDTNGAHQEASVVLHTPEKDGNPFVKNEDVVNVKKKWLNLLSKLVSTSFWHPIAVKKRIVDTTIIKKYTFL